MRDELEAVLQKNKCTQKELDIIFKAAQKISVDEREIFFKAIINYPELATVVVDLFRRKLELLQNFDKVQMQKILSEEEKILQNILDEQL
jgi:hypothetical protein